MRFRRAIFTALAALVICALPEFCAAQGTYNNGANNQGQYNNSQTVTCTTRRNSSTRKYCAADTENATVTLQQQTSSAACTQNQTWGYDDEGIWVSSGCGGVFAVNPANTGYNNGNGDHNGGYGRHHDNGQYATGDVNGQTVRCDSNGYNADRQYCPVDARGGVRMAREYSNNVCRQGSNWGYDNGGIWVSNGCSADFQTYGTGSRRSYSGRTTTIPAGTQVSIRADEAIDSRNAYVGQRYAADVASDVTDSSGTVIIPRGTQAELILHDANDSYNNNPNTNNNANNNQNLVLDLDSVTVNGERYIVSTQDVTSAGSGIGANKKTGTYVGGGAVLGAIIGAVAGGGKGAAIGAAVGAGAGAGGVILTKGKNVNVPVETVLNFKLDQDLSLQAVR